MWMPLAEVQKIPKLYSAYLKEVNSKKNNNKKLTTPTVIDNTQQKNKMWNKKISNMFWEFDSKMEFEHFIVIKDTTDRLWLKIERQKTYVIMEWFKIEEWLSWKETYRPLTYKADFTIYSSTGEELMVIDSKWFKTDKFMIKRKLFAKKYNKNIVLVSSKKDINIVLDLLNNLVQKK